MRLLRDERGEMTVAHMLVAMAIMLGVLGATLTVFSSAEKLNRQANERVDSQDRARVALDGLAAQLRNLASPTNDQPQAIDLAGPFDLVFQTVDRVGPNTGLNAANVMRVRYCLGSANTTALYRQEQRWTTQVPPASPSVSTCPAAQTATGWSATSVAATDVVNRRDGLDRAMFVYNAASASDISAVHAQLYVDGDVTRAPAEAPLSTGVFLRNQNRRPVATFSADTSVYRTIVLNGATSADPEGDPLEYVWLINGEKRGEGPRYDHAVAAGGTYQVQLKVYDLAKLEGVSAVQSVVVP